MLANRALHLLQSDAEYYRSVPEYAEIMRALDRRLGCALDRADALLRLQTERAKREYENGCDYVWRLYGDCVEDFREDALDRGLGRVEEVLALCRGVDRGLVGSPPSIGPLVGCCFLPFFAIVLYHHVPSYTLHVPTHLFSMGQIS